MGEMGILKVILDIPIPIDKLYIKKLGKIFFLSLIGGGGGRVQNLGDIFPYFTTTPP